MGSVQEFSRRLASTVGESRDKSINGNCHFLYTHISVNTVTYSSIAGKLFGSEFFSCQVLFRQSSFLVFSCMFIYAGIEKLYVRHEQWGEHRNRFAIIYQSVV
jgi:hypothetical protein